MCEHRHYKVDNNAVVLTITVIILCIMYTNLFQVKTVGFNIALTDKYAVFTMYCSNVNWGKHNDKQAPTL